MSYLTEVNCSSILEAIFNEKKQEKEKDNADSDDYVVLNRVNTFWTDLFARCFLCETKICDNQQHDDMLYLVTRSASIDRIEVYRRDSKRLPCLTDLNYDWEETIYLNLILHQLEYTLTCAICTQTSVKDLQILKKHSKKVYASPSRRDLSFKGSEEVITYPNIYFTIDDFDDAFNEMIVNEGEMVCVELLANDGKKNHVLFLGSIKYESLKKVYDTRASVSMKLVQTVSLGAINQQKRVEFVKMKGPNGKGYAEMAVSRHKPTSNSGLSTPNSLASSPMSESFNENYFQNKGSNSNLAANWGNWKFANFNKRSSIKTPEIELRNIKDELSDNNATFWNRTLNQAFTWMKKSEHVAGNNNIDHNTIRSTPLNAYLTYVNLSLQAIILDALECQQKSVLTF